MIKEIDVVRKYHELYDRLKEKYSELIAMVAKKYGVPPPKVRILSLPHGKLHVDCKVEDVDGFYDYSNQEINIYIDGSPISVLHEFAHHLQFVRSGYDEKKAFGKNCEKEAKEFALKEHAELCGKSFYLEISDLWVEFCNFYHDNKKILS